MSEQEQISAIAELDGWNREPEKEATSGFPWGFVASKPKWWHMYQLPQYLTSRDAIVPVIERQSAVIKDKISHEIKWQHGTTVGFLFPLLMTSAQLAEALLRAIGKWRP